MKADDLIAEMIEEESYSTKKSNVTKAFYRGVDVEEIHGQYSVKLIRNTKKNWGKAKKVVLF